jgi:hypothetical protein
MGLRRKRDVVFSDTEREKRLKEISDRVNVDKDIYLSPVKVRKAVQIGLIVVPDACERCGTTAGNSLSGHHEDHSKPFDVVWVCKRCHTILDRLRERRLAGDRSARVHEMLARKVMKSKIR